MLSLLLALTLMAAAVCRAGAQSTGNIAFELADLMSFVPFGTDTYLVEAFKDKDNDHLLANNKSQLMRWVSLGVPKLLTTRAFRRSNEPFRMFQVTRSGVSVHVLLLTDKQRNMLVEAAQKKYGVHVSSQQILQLIPARFECSLNAFGDDSLILHGRVGDFQSNPLRIDFEVANNSFAGWRFLYRLASTPELDLDILINCKISSQGILRKQNVMHVTGEQVMQLSLDDRLFGPAESTLVTRNQLTELASEIYTTLNVAEDYEVPEERFGQAVVDSLVRQAASVGFGMTPVKEALAGLSTYKLDYSDRDIMADHIYKNMSDSFHLVKDGKKAYLKTLDASANLATSSGSTGSSCSGGSSSGGWWLWRWSNSHSDCYTKSWTTQTYNTNSISKEMIDEVNKEFGTNVQWASEGDKVIPKALNVAKLTKTDFKKGFTFSQVARFAYDAPFLRSVALYTRDFETIEDIFSADRASISRFTAIHDASLNRVLAARAQLSGQTGSAMNASVAAMAAAEEARFSKANAKVTARVKEVRAKADTRIAACRVCYASGVWPEKPAPVITAEGSTPPVEPETVQPDPVQVCSALSNAESFGPEVTMSNSVALAFQCQANV